MTTEISLMQITKIKREAAFSMPETHFHDDHEVLYLVSGECNIFLNHTIYKLQAGDMVLIPSGYIHKTNYTGKEESTRFAFRFTTDDVRWLIDTVGDQVLNELLEKIIFETRRLIKNAYDQFTPAVGPCRGIRLRYAGF